MSKQSQLEKAIAQLEGERAVLDLALQKMRAQLVAHRPKTRKAKPVQESSAVVMPENAKGR